MNFRFFFLSFLCVVVFLAMPEISFAKLSNDPFAQQWSYEHIGVYDAWDYTTGSKDVIVAVIDNGFDIYHPDLRDNVWENEGEIANNGIDDDGNGYIDDVYGWNFLDDNNNPRPSVKHVTEQQRKDQIYSHGTFVAGIIGAKGDNGRDGVGVNWDVRLMNLKVIGNTGTGDLTPLADAIYYAVDNGADIVNVSMIGTGSDEEITQAVDYAYDSGVLVVAAAGNSLTDLNFSPRYPVCSDNESSVEKVLGISAIDEGHHLAIFSNSGSTCIDLAAPGVGVQSTVFFSPENDLNESYLDTGWNGTSFAAPLVSGAAALLKSIQPTWGPQELIDTLLTTVHHTPGQDEEIYANLFGAGLLQVDNAVEFALEGTNFKDSEFSKEQNSTTIPHISTLKEYTGQERMMFVAPDSGVYEKRTHGSEDAQEIVRPAFEGVEDIEHFTFEEGGTGYATIREDGEGVHTISIYNADFRRIYRWEFVGDSDGTYDIAVGDVRGDYNPEVLLSPKQRDETYVYLYSLEGEYIDALQDAAHDGVSVDIIYDDLREIYDIALVYKYEDSVFVERVEGSSFLSVDAWYIEGIEGDYIAVGDIDNDGVDEYVISARPGKQTRIAVLEQDGTISLTFRAYPASYKDGAFVRVFDYDGDEKNDIVVSPQSGEMPVRIFSSYGRLTEEWYAFDTPRDGNVLVTQL